MHTRIDHIAKNLAAVGFGCILALILFEIGLSRAIKVMNIPIQIPTYSMKNVTPFWVDINPDFGVWHNPNRSFLHQNVAFQVRYFSNSYGARDEERSVKSNENRVVVLGDSFIEGYGIERDARISDLLEEHTGQDHLNFGTSGNFGTTQEVILYETLAMEFDHDSVLLGMLPANDFRDDDIESGRIMHENRYRPYCIGEYPDYRIVYYRHSLHLSHANESEPNIRSYLSSFTYTYNLLSYLKALYLGKREGSTSQHGYSGYYDYTEQELSRMHFLIDRLCHLANQSGRRVYIFTIPVYEDLVRYGEEKSELAPLAIELTRLSRDIGFEYLDLLPMMYKREGKWKRYFNLGEPHWNEYGHKIASEILLSNLGLYKQMVGAPH